MTATTTPEQWGPNLYAYLERYWRALGTNANAWANEHPAIQGPTVSRWRTGTEPSLHAFLAVADALGVPRVDVLAAVGVIDKREIGREAAAPPEPDIDAAIASDPSLSPFARDTLRGILAHLRAVESGESEHARGRHVGAEPRRRGRRS